MESKAGQCPQCGEALPDALHASPRGRFRICGREECGATVPESAEEWRARVLADLEAAEARVARLHEALDRADEMARGRRVPGAGDLLRAAVADPEGVLNAIQAELGE